MGAVSRVQLLYDRQDRSRGIGYVVMPDPRDARLAVREFDGANANGQPIRLTLLPTPSAAAAAPARNPFDTAERPTRSLFDRIERPAARARSESPDRSRRRVDSRRSDVSKPAPENIDRYVPGGSRENSRRRSPLPRRGEGPRRGDRAGRRPGERRRRSPAKDAEGHVIVQGRPRKTQEELDAEMADYWGKQENAAENGNGESTNGAAAAPATTDNDIDMIE
jgi:THO complex subunit 4